jgi:dienelactone hydrolase
MKQIANWSRSLAAPTYFAYPKDNGSPERAIILISDVFGIISNSQLLADDFARDGYLTVIPDIFAGDPLLFGDYEAGKVNFPEWLAKHPVESVDPVIEATIKHLRDNLGVKKVAAVGYCFGGKVQNAIISAVTLHSLLIIMPFFHSTSLASSRTESSTRVILPTPPSSRRRNLVLLRILFLLLLQVGYSLYHLNTNIWRDRTDSDVIMCYRDR